MASIAAVICLTNIEFCAMVQTLISGLVSSTFPVLSDISDGIPSASLSISEPACGVPGFKYNVKVCTELS